MSMHSNPTPVVRPEWIVDSIKAQTLLSEEDYLLERLRGGPAQKMIHAFKAVTAQPLDDDVIYPAARPSLSRLQQESDDQQQHCLTVHEQSVEAAEPSVLSGTLPAGTAIDATDEREASGNAAEDEDADAFSFMATSPNAHETEAGGADASGDHVNGAAQCGPGHVGIRPSASACLPVEQRQRAANDDAASQFGSADAVPEPRPPRQAAAPRWTADDMRVAQAAAAAARSRCDMLKVCAPRPNRSSHDAALIKIRRNSCGISRPQGAPKSTRDDPDYVKNYFAASRLHFIGTWKVLA